MRLPKRIGSTPAGAGKSWRPNAALCLMRRTRPWWSIKPRLLPGERDWPDRPPAAWDPDNPDAPALERDLPELPPLALLTAWESQLLRAELDRVQPALHSARR